MNSILHFIVEKCDRVLTYIVLLTVALTIKPLVVFAADEKPATKPSQAISQTVEDADKMSLSISIDEKKGVEIKGLAELKKRLKGLESLKELENLKDLKGLEKEIEASLKGIGQIDAEVSGLLDEKEVKKMEEIAAGAIGITQPWFLWVSLAPFVFGFAVFFLFLYFRSRSRKETLATIRLMVEKGQPVPPDLLASLTGTAHSQSFYDSTPTQGSNKSFLLSGLKPLFWGLGIVLFFVFERLNSEEWFIGVIFILVGLYHMTKSYLIKEGQSQKNAFDKKTDIENSKIDLN